MATSSALLPWSRATRTGVTQNEQTNDEELRLTWENDKTTLADRATAISELYAISHVVDLKIDDDRVTYAGTWRNAGCGWDGRSGKFYIELRKGWATTTPENMAVYVNVSRSNQSGKLTLVRKWQFIDPAEVEKLMKSSNANTNVLANVVNDPLADGKIYEGEWLAITTEGPKTAQDGCTIIQTLLKAGDADLTVILGTNKMTSSREVYKWQTTATDLEAFRTHTGVYATEFDYKWDVAEVGIQKDWQPSQGGDYSLNLVARYIVKESWQYPEATATPDNDFVVVTNIDGIVTEKLQKFHNRIGLPTASTGDIVKAIETELGVFDGEIRRRSTVKGVGDTDKSYVTLSSKSIEWDVEKSTARIPSWTTFTNSYLEPKITGYSVLAMRIYWYRTVTISITRTYYIGQQTIGTPAAAERAYTGQAEAIAGGSTSQSIEVIDLGDGIFAVDTTNIEVTDWARPATVPTPVVLYSTSA